MKKPFIHLFCLSVFFLFYSCDNIIEENTPANVFEVFWRIMDENYPFFEEKGVDWDSIYDIYAPKARTARNDEELFDIFHSILPLFQDGHLRISCVATFTSAISLSIPLSINNDVEKLIDAGFEVIHSERMFLVLENRKNRMAYLKLNSFNHQDTNISIHQPERLLKNLDFTNGLIIDLSNNIGGSLPYCLNFVSVFFTGRKITLYQQRKTGKGRSDFGDKIPISIQGKGYVPDEIPIVILTSRGTYSSGNFAVYILTDLRNSTVIGTPTSGGGGGRVTVFLPNGWKLMYPVYRGFSPSGRNMEFGFEPDICVEVEFPWEFRDAMLAVALEYLENLQRK